MAFVYWVIQQACPGGDWFKWAWLDVKQLAGMGGRDGAKGSGRDGDDAAEAAAV